MKNNKRGMTLIELILSSVITVLVIGAACTLMILGMKVFQSTAEAAQQQKDIRLAEAVLKENLATAMNYDFSADKDGEVQLYYAGDVLTMVMGSQTLTLNTITSISVTFVERAVGVSYAMYEIEAQGRTQSGSVVLNNVNGASDASVTYLLDHSQTNTLNMDMP